MSSAPARRFTGTIAKRTKDERMSHADVNGVSLYYEEHGSGEPLVLLHGGLGAGAMFEAIMPELAAHRRVITVDLQAHGGTADVDRPLRPQTMADDVAALVEHLGLPHADVVGYSLGGLVALRTALQHPQRVRRMVLVSVGFRRDGSHPEVVENMDRFAPEMADMLAQSPLYQVYSRLAPRVEDWPVLIAKTSEMLKDDYDWTAEVEGLETPTMLVFADADSIRPAHIVEFYGLLGGGLRDANWDGSLRPTARLAILPATTHYDISASPALAPAVTAFLDADAL
jgi:pimeloyl-ACP methyl ester carboxylesterase